MKKFALCVFLVCSALSAFAAISQQQAPVSTWNSSSSSSCSPIRFNIKCNRSLCRVDILDFIERAYG
jgi:hypothetical protein